MTEVSRLQDEIQRLSFLVEHYRRRLAERAAKRLREKVDVDAQVICEMIKSTTWYSDRMAQIDDWDREGEALLRELREVIGTSR